jgi:hypothetical protein
LNFFAGSTPIQCFPFYTYEEDPSASSRQAYNRRENITDWALAQFRAYYGGLHLAGGVHLKSEQSPHGRHLQGGAHVDREISK